MIKIRFPFNVLNVWNLCKYIYLNLTFMCRQYYIREQFCIQLYLNEIFKIQNMLCLLESRFILK